MNRMDLHNNNEQMQRRIGTKPLMIALLIVAIGVVLLLKNLNMLSSEAVDVLFSWPAIILAIGLMNLGGQKSWFGFLLIVFGGFFMLSNYLNWNVEFSKVFWPLLLIILGIGIIIISSGRIKTHRLSTGTASDNRIEEIAIFGGGERIVNAPAFEGGEIISIFGGSKIDFRRSKLSEGVNELEMINLFGGSSIMVPPDWNIKSEVISIFGGFADKRFNSEIDPSKTLVIKGIAIFGGGEIKN